MGKSYVGINGVARENKKIYVSINGIAREVKKAYVGVNGIAKEIYSGEVLKPLKIRITYNPQYGASAIEDDEFYFVKYAESFYLYNTTFNIEYDPNTGIISGGDGSIRRVYSPDQEFFGQKLLKWELKTSNNSYKNPDATCEIIDPGSMIDKNFTLIVSFRNVFGIDDIYI